MRADGGVLADESTLTVAARSVLTEELERLVGELRNGAVEQAELACSGRVALLEKAVHELMTAMDGETHRLLLKWRGALEASRRENGLLQEQLRVAHVRAIDMGNLIADLEAKQVKPAVDERSGRKPRLPDAARGCALGSDRAAVAAAAARCERVRPMPARELAPPPPPRAAPLQAGAGAQQWVQQFVPVQVPTQLVLPSMAPGCQWGGYG